MTLDRFNRYNYTFGGLRMQIEHHHSDGTISNADRLQLLIGVQIAQELNEIKRTFVEMLDSKPDPADT